MKQYLIKRILLFIPMLVLISLLAFYISTLAPGDPAENHAESITGAGNVSLSEQRLIQKKYWHSRLGLDLPLFYLSLHPLSEPDTLHRIYPASEKNALLKLIRLYGNWEAISTYYSSLKSLQSIILFTAKNLSQADSSKALLHENINELKFEAMALPSVSEHYVIMNRLRTIENLLNKDHGLPSIKKSLGQVKQHYRQMQEQPEKFRNFIPVISFHASNQYHRWIFGDGNWLTGKGAVFSKGILRGDFGTSYLTGLPVMSELWPRISWSLTFSILAMIISYIVSVPLGLYSASRPGMQFDTITGSLLFLLFSLPLYWVATLLLLLFANPSTLLLFPASGVMPVTGYPPDASIGDKILLTLPYLILPLFCYSYPAITVMARTLRNAVSSELGKDYIRTARAKGLPAYIILKKHAFANSKLPLITIIANVFPMCIAGSIIIESIFSIPGMGLETLHAISNKNYPVLVAIFTLTGFMTLSGFLLADLVYAFADPRISFSRKTD